MSNFKQKSELKIGEKKSFMKFLFSLKNFFLGCFFIFFFSFINYSDE